MPTCIRVEADKGERKARGEEEIVAEDIRGLVLLESRVADDVL